MSCPLLRHQEEYLRKVMRGYSYAAIPVMLLLEAFVIVSQAVMVLSVFVVTQFG
jgi:hypothetical protein